MLTEAKYKKWLALQQQLAKLKAEELDLRREICDEMFEGRQGEFKDSRETKNLMITAESRVNRSVDAEALSAIMEDLSEEEKNCIKFKPSLDTRLWRKLPDDSRLHEAVIEKQSPTPTLKVEIKV